eukprot:UN03283
MGLTGGGSSSRAKTKQFSQNPMSIPCYAQPFAAIAHLIGQQHNNGLHPKYPRRYNEMYKRRQNRIKHNKSNYEQFGENDLMYDPNKQINKPEDRDRFYE